MESFSDREISTPKNVQTNHEHLMASAFGAPPQRRSADTRASSHPVEQPSHPVEPPKPTKPVEPPKPTHPVEPPKPTHPVEPPKPTHPVEPPKPPVEPPTRPPQRDFSPPAEPFRPRVPEKQETKTPPTLEKHTPTPERPAPEKPAVPVTPPEQSKTVPPSEKSHSVPPPEKVVPVAPEKHGKPGEVKITIDHTYKSDEEHRTIQKRVEHSDAKTVAQKHVKDTSHEKLQHKAEEKKEHQVSQKSQHADSTHHSSHNTHHRSTHHHSSSHHRTEGHHKPTHHKTSDHKSGDHKSSDHKSGEHKPSHHKTTDHKTSDHKSTHQADTHHVDAKHKAVQKAESHHADKQTKAAQVTHQKDASHVVDKAKAQEKKKDVEVTTVHIDKKHVEEHTRIEFSVKLPEPPAQVEPIKPIEPVKEPVQHAKPELPVEQKTEPKAAPVEPPPVVQSPPAEPTKVEKPEKQSSLKPGDTNELSTSISRDQVTATLTHEHHVDPKTYYRASVNAGIAGDHTGLGNTSLTVGRHLFNPYDKDGNPARGNVNLEGGLVLKTGHTYDYGKLPRFGDTAAHVGVNGYYQLKRDLTLYGSVDAASNPKQFDAQFGAIKDSGRLSLQLGAEYSKVEGYGGSRFVTPGVSYRLNKNTSIYASGAINMDGHKERNGLWTGFRVGF